MNYPPIDGAVIDVETALFHDFFDVSITQAVGQVPTHRLKDHILVEMAAAEADHDLFDPRITGRPV